MCSVDAKENDNESPESIHPDSVFGPRGGQVQYDPQEKQTEFDDKRSGDRVPQSKPEPCLSARAEREIVFMDQEIQDPVTQHEQSHDERATRGSAHEVEKARKKQCPEQDGHQAVGDRVVGELDR
jgi:predicted secreted Zn-dependent protease